MCRRSSPAGLVAYGERGGEDEGVRRDLADPKLRCYMPVPFVTLDLCLAVFRGLMGYLGLFGRRRRGG
jgi:hypothetical protein